MREMFLANVKKLIEKINPGNTDISHIGDGTLTGAISSVNDALTWKEYPIKGTTGPETSRTLDLSSLSDAHEFLFVIAITSDGGQNLTILVDKDTLANTTGVYFRDGYYYNSSNYSLVQMYLKDMTVTAQLYLQGTSTKDYTYTVKYR